jgi:hypothetical protein
MPSVNMNKITSLVGLTTEKDKNLPTSHDNGWAGYAER